MIAPDEKLMSTLLTAILNREQRRFSRVEHAHYEIMIRRRLIRRHVDGTYELTEKGRRAAQRALKGLENEDVPITEDSTQDETSANLPADIETV
jgi:DNA-binding PadR family transcriptional regulator